MPYTTAAQWRPVISNVADKMSVCDALIRAVEYGKAVPKYLEEQGPGYEQSLSPAQITALRQAFLQMATAARDALNAALA